MSCQEIGLAHDQKISKKWTNLQEFVNKGYNGRSNWLIILNGPGSGPELLAHNWPPIRPSSWTQLTGSIFLLAYVQGNNRSHPFGRDNSENPRNY